ncbi:MAG: efflux RND transporter periplasmic adaptor subunit [Pontibacterium sp.]
MFRVKPQRVQKYFGALVFAGALSSVSGLSVANTKVDALLSEMPEDSLSQQGIRAQVVAGVTAELAAEMPGRITSLKGFPGDSFKQGASLAKFDCAEQGALLQKAKASEVSAKTELAVAKRLVELDAGSTLEVSKAQARWAETQAESSVMKTRVAKCQIRAPFSGRVAKRLASEHEFVAVGTPLLEVYAASSLEVRTIVPSRWLVKMKKGDRFFVQVEETGKRYEASIVRVGAEVDPVSQSVEVAGKIQQGLDELLPGMSGWARFDYPPSAN